MRMDTMVSLFKTRFYPYTTCVDSNLGGKPGWRSDL